MIIDYWYPQKILHFYFYSHMAPSVRTFDCLKITGQKYLPWLSSPETKNLSFPLSVVYSLVWYRFHLLENRSISALSKPFSINKTSNFVLSVRRLLYWDNDLLMPNSFELIIHSFTWGCKHLWTGRLWQYCLQKWLLFLSWLPSLLPTLQLKVSLCVFLVAQVSNSVAKYKVYSGKLLIAFLILNYI